ncbi:MAG: methyltransferase domain-containing protein [Candidatus Burarchaeum sp.]|nr:class I SAM-dependent methyltransferase [Candidatus Burarchaeum sp.]MDO8339433.1 methyltransferase domain-containing protein [Candidatus Burarchaeum sp.]
MNFWDERFAREGELWGAEPSQGAKFAADYFAKCKARTVLDVASGYGRDSIFLAKNRGFEVLGIDSSAEGIRQANETAAHEKVAIRFVQADVRMMPFGPESFDAILCNGILSHLLPQEREMTAREIGRVLRKGGALVVSEFSLSRRPEGTKEVDAKLAGENETFREHDEMVHHYFRREELEFLFPSIKFECIEEHEEARGEGREARLKWVLAGVKR